VPYSLNPIVAARLINSDSPNPSWGENRMQASLARKLFASNQIWPVLTTI